MRIKVLKSYLKTIFKNRKSSLIYLIVGSIIDLLVNLLSIYVPKLFLDYILLDKELDYLIFSAILLLIFSVISRIIKSKLNIEKEIQDQVMMMEIVNKVNKFPYHYLEDKEIQEKKESAIFAIQNYGAVYYLYEKVIEFLSSFITIISLLTILISYNLFFVLIIFSCSLLILLINNLLLKKKSEFNKGNIKTNYEYGYFSELICEKKYQIGNRVYSYSKIISKYVDELNKKITIHFRKLRGTEANYLSAILIFEYIQKFISYLIPTILLFRKQIDIPNFTLLINCGINVSQKINSIINSYQEINNSLEYLIPFYELMQIEELRKSGNVNYESFNSIEFKNVSFKYPNTDKNILENINFKINKNENIAILGLNGSGKSTIVKLLLKLYSPQKGEIIVNNVNIKEYNKSYLDKISVVFQDVRLFPITLKENIIANSIFDESNLDNTLNKLQINELFNKKNIKLDNLYNSEVFEEGVEFSGGEKQLITISRALYRNSDLIILDEPSSALDPVMTNTIINKFKIFMENHTTILVTHNLKLAKMCDRILVLDKNNNINELDTKNIDENIIEKYLEKNEN